MKVSGKRGIGRKALRSSFCVTSAFFKDVQIQAVPAMIPGTAIVCFEPLIITLHCVVNEVLSQLLEDSARGDPQKESKGWDDARTAIGGGSVRYAPGCQD